jgi:hypothetical protein
MEFAIAFGGAPQDVAIILSGVATPEGFRRFNEARLSDERFRKGLVILLDASSLDTSQMSESMLQTAVEPMLERELIDPPLALAIVAPDARTFKDAIITRAHLGGQRSHRAVFASREEALFWLKGQRRRADSAQS